MDILSYLDTWISQHTADLSAAGLKTDIRRTPTDVERPAIVLDLDSETRIGRITVWSNGDCNLEAMDAQSGQILLFEHTEITSRQVFENCINKLLHHMK